MMISTQFDRLVDIVLKKKRKEKKNLKNKHQLVYKGMKETERCEVKNKRKWTKNKKGKIMRLRQERMWSR